MGDEERGLGRVSSHGGASSPRLAGFLLGGGRGGSAALLPLPVEALDVARCHLSFEKTFVLAKENKETISFN